MKRHEMFMKKTMAVLLTVVMISLSVIASPVTAKAEATDQVTEETGVTYILDTVQYDFSAYWSETPAQRKAPVKEGYVFGGWYTKNGDVFTAVTEGVGAGISEAYAKFVPAYVLSIKAQNAAGTTAGDGNTSIRIVSSVDSLTYQEVGFEILLNNKHSIGACAATRVYSRLQNSEEGVAIFPADAFGAASAYFSVWRLDNINDANDSKIIYARPYWVTKDGTRVEGLAKYVHIEDGYNSYVSVPLNLLTGEDVAIGTVELTYDADVFTFHGFEAGRLLPQMSENHAVAGTITIVGNATPGAGVYEDVSADGIFANVRFTVNPDESTAGAVFNATAGDFCNWSETLIDTVTAWDVNY